MKLKIIFLFVLIVSVTGCASLENSARMGPDQTAQAFFDDLQRSDRRAAYSLFAQGLSQRITYAQFDELMDAIRDRWGSLNMADTVVMPFHKRLGEDHFIPLRVTPEEIKRYIFDTKFDSAEINFDVTLAPQDGQYKIIWFAMWGSSNDFSLDIQEKLEILFIED